MKNLISKHLNSGHLGIKIHQVDAICAFTGDRITEGVLLSDLIKKTFTDHELIRFNSEYASVDIALLMEMVIPAEKGLNSLRNYSFYASDKKLVLLKREETLPLLFSIPDKAFQVGITYSNKKHIAYKAPVNFDRDEYKIITDRGMVVFERKTAQAIFTLAQKWYSVVPAKAETKVQPTWFTKEQIRGAAPSVKQITEYGTEAYLNENRDLEKYRGTALFELIVNFLKKAL